MKVRKGFVSNSSSSSFVIIGIDVSDLRKKVIEQGKYTEQNIYDFPNELAGELGLDYRWGDMEEKLIGKLLLDSYNDIYPTNTVDVLDATKIQEIQDIIDGNEITKGKKVQIYYGNTSC